MFFVNAALNDISIGTAGLVALLGYAVVFVGLIALMAVIMIVGKIMVAKKSAPAAAPAAAAAAPASAPKAVSLDGKRLDGSKWTYDKATRTVNINLTGIPCDRKTVVKVSVGK